MSVIDIEKLLAEVSPEAPSGPKDLEYDPAFLEMERAAQGKPEQQIGEMKVEAEGPQWKEVRGKALDVLGRGKYIRASVFLSQALLGTDGFVGFADGLALLRGLVEKYWDTLHPQLDPEDGLDPTMRVNILASLCGDSALKQIRETTLVESRGIGRFSLRDVLVSTGKMPPLPGGAAPPAETATIDAAFKDNQVETLQATATAIAESIGHVAAIESFLMEKVGSKHAADFSPLTAVLKSAQQPLSEQLAQRGVVSAGVAGQAEGGAAAPAAAGEIRSREDAIRLLDRMCDYFETHEPSSPVPILLRRAKRLVSKNFMDIIKDLASDGLSQVERIRGEGS